MRRIIQAAILASLMLCSSLAFGQYEEESEPYIEGFVNVNGTLPMGYLKNDLLVSGANLNAKAGVGLDIGGGYYFTSSLIAGLYFSARNMGVEDFGFHHRIFEGGLYGKYQFMNISENSWTPYARVTLGLSYSKFASRVKDGATYIYRELSYAPTLGMGGGLGVYLKLNSRGGIFAEGSYHMDLMKGVVGEFKNVDYRWGDYSQYIVIGAGVKFNIGPNE